MPITANVADPCKEFLSALREESRVEGIQGECGKRGQTRAYETGSAPAPGKPICQHRVFGRIYTRSPWWRSRRLGAADLSGTKWFDVP